jgi:hypothetical protein
LHEIISVYLQGAGLASLWSLGALHIEIILSLLPWNTVSHKETGHYLLVFSEKS